MCVRVHKLSRTIEISWKVVRKLVKKIGFVQNPVAFKIARNNTFESGLTFFVYVRTHKCTRCLYLSLLMGALF